MFFKIFEKMLDIYRDMKNPNKIFRFHKNISRSLKIDLALGKIRKNQEKSRKHSN